MNEPAEFGVEEGSVMPVSGLAPDRQAKFVGRVYGLLSLQLAVTFSIICLFIFNDTVKQFVQATPAMLSTAIALSFVLMIVLACCKSVAQSWPLNLILLALFTLCEAYVLGALSSFYETSLVIQAVFLTIVITCALTAWGLTTHRDLSVMGNVLAVCSLVFVFGGLLRLVFPSTPVLETLWAALGTLLFAAYILYDTWLLKNQLTEDAYVTAALFLYVDIVNLFVNLLKLLSACLDQPDE